MEACIIVLAHHTWDAMNRELKRLGGDLFSLVCWVDKTLSMQRIDGLALRLDGDAVGKGLRIPSEARHCKQYWRFAMLSVYIP